MGLSKQLIVSISEEFARRNNVLNPIQELDGITFCQVGKNTGSLFYLGFKLDKHYSFYKGYTKDGKLNYKEIFFMPLYNGDF